MPHVFELLLIFLLIVFLLFASVFDYSQPYRFLGETEDWSTVGIELVEIDGEITYGDEAVFEQKLRTVAVIEDNELFIKELKKLKNTRPFGDPSTHVSGKGILLTYPNGDIELITERGVAFIDNGKLDTYFRAFEEEAYLAFWENWAREPAAVTA